MTGSGPGTGHLPSPPIEIAVSGADETRAIGRRLAAVLRAGDLVVLSGDLGAGKTTFAQGVGAGLGVRGDVTSPTFVISRVHPPLGDGPALVHVDAYRVTGALELDDLDLDETLTEAVTLVEWGDGIADGLSSDRLRVHLDRERGVTPSGSWGADARAGGGHHVDSDSDAEDETRTITVQAFGDRWDLRALEHALASTQGH